MTAEEWRIAGFTLQMAAMSTLLILPPGLLLGWLLARRKWPGKSLIETLVTLPLARRGVAGGVVLAFARAVGEFGATILVAGDIPGRTRTIALAIYERVQLGDDTSAYRMVAVAAIIAFAALWISETLLRPRRRP